MEASGVDHADVALVFTTADAYRRGSEMLRAIRRTTAAAAVLGCSGAGVLTEAGEVEEGPAVAVMVLRTDGEPGLDAFLVAGRDVLDDEAGGEIADRVGAGRAREGGVVILPDATNLSPNPLLLGFADVVEPIPIVGGVAAGMPLFELFGEDVAYGALAALATSRTPIVGVAQGCEPVGEPFAVTACAANVIREIGGRSPLGVLREAIESVPDHAQRVARYGLFAGIAVDLLKSPLTRGDFLVRAIVGVDQETGWITLPETVFLGQTIQFQLRDPQAAHDDLVATLGRVEAALAGRRPAFGLYFNCAGRGRALYGTTGHDLALIRQRLGDWPLIGFFGNGEFAPLGRENLFHNYTGVLVLFTAA
jgi:small ligand-binding sensory domain FIST